MYNFVPEIYLTISISVILLSLSFSKSGILKMTYGINVSRNVFDDVEESPLLAAYNGIFVLLITLILSISSEKITGGLNLDHGIVYSISNIVFASQVDFFVFDSITYLSQILILIFGIIYIYIILSLVSYDKRYSYEFIILILTSILGMLLLIKANDFLSIYLAIELQSMGMYTLAAFSKSKYGAESGLKYYVMGGLASSILLLGIGIIYGATGVTNINELFDLLDNIKNIEGSGYSYLSCEKITGDFFKLPILCIYHGIFLVLVAIIFKLGGAPFHIWLPDVYQGAPLASTAFFSIVPKLSLFIILIRLAEPLSSSYLISFSFGSITIVESIVSFISIVAILSMLIGTIQALAQKNLKRLFTYSSISHVGFILVGFIAVLTSKEFGTPIFYILIYTFMIMSLFGIIIEYKISQINTDYYNISSLKNLSEKQRLLGLFLSILLFSMAGIPPLAGFFSKYYILETAIYNDYFILSFIVVLSSILATVYYIQLIQYLYFYGLQTSVVKKSHGNENIVQVYNKELKISNLVLSSCSSTGNVSNSMIISFMFLSLIFVCCFGANISYYTDVNLFLSLLNLYF